MDFKEMPLERSCCLAQKLEEEGRTEAGLEMVRVEAELQSYLLTSRALMILKKSLQRWS